MNPLGLFAFPSAREDVDYERAKLTWLWDVTSIADKLIIDQNQQIAYRDSLLPQQRGNGIPAPVHEGLRFY